MMMITCPYCGARPETEFRYGGEAVARPTDSMALDDPALEAILYVRENNSRVVREQWVHADGCRMWMWVKRCRTTHQVLSVEAFETA